MAPKPPYTEAVAAAVKFAIETAETNITAVAKATGIPQVTLSRCLADPGEFKLWQLDRIAAHLGVPVKQFSAPHGWAA